MLLRQVAGGGVCSLVFSSDSATLYSGDVGGWVSSWHRASGERRKLFQLKGRLASDILRLAVTRDDQRILAGTPNSFAVWDAVSQTFWPTEPKLAWYGGFALAADDRTLAAVRQGNSIVFSDLVERGPRPTNPMLSISDPDTYYVSYLVFSPIDGTLAAATIGGGIYLIEAGAEKPIRLNPVVEGKVCETSPLGHPLAFSTNGGTLAASGGRSILLWDTTTRQLRRTIKAGRAIVRQLAFHPNGKILASGGDTPVVTLWDVDTGKVRQRFDWGIGGKILSLAFAPDGMTAAAGGSNRKFVVWDIDD